VRDHLPERECERFGPLVSSKHQFVPLLYVHRTPGEPADDQFLVVTEHFIFVGVVQDAVVAESEPAETDHDCDKLLQSARVVVCREADCGGYENDRAVCVVELDAITIHEGGGRVRAEGRDGELVREIPPDLNIGILLAIRLPSPRLPGSLPPDLGATTARS